MATSDSSSRAARERKQKIFVAVAGPVLLLALAFQLPGLLGGGSSPSTVTTTTEATVDDPAPSRAELPPVRIALADTDRPLAPDSGQLRSFGLFAHKDPFVQQVESSDFPGGGSGGEGSGGEGSGDAGSGAEGSGDSGKVGSKPTETAKKPPSKGFTVGTTAAAVTIISVNGTRQALVPGAAFPASNPVFVLVAEQPQVRTVTVGVAGGAYESGAKATKLKVGKPLILVNTATGARYKLVLVAVGNGEASSASDDGKGSATKP